MVCGRAPVDHLKDMREIAFKKLEALNLAVIDGKIIDGLKAARIHLEDTGD